MSIPVILFFTSLLSIMIMIGRKLFSLESEQVLVKEEITFELPYLREVKELTSKKIKEHGYTGLVTTLRVYIRSTDFIRNEFKAAKMKVKNFGNRNRAGAEKKETSKFLKVMGEYKQKIREIKHKIRKEENL